MMLLKNKAKTQTCKQLKKNPDIGVGIRRSKKKLDDQELNFQ